MGICQKYERERSKKIFAMLLRSFVFDLKTSGFLEAKLNRNLICLCVERSHKVGENNTEVAAGCCTG